MESFAQLIQSQQPVLVDFFATWCGPCKAMEPVIKDVAKSVEGKVRVVKVDIDKQRQIASQYNVSAVPTFMIFKNGNVVWRHPGMIDKNSLLNMLNQSV
ncbi:thioredoxin [Parafilimonas sp.]|uniref:thioredoxin n=1 Tax=Parafilimonas sp. TaxID=1969739 RepID=UPI003F81F14A